MTQTGGKREIDMGVTRRLVLKALAAIPLVGIASPAAAEAVVPDSVWTLSCSNGLPSFIVQVFGERITVHLGDEELRLESKYENGWQFFVGKNGNCITLRHCQGPEGMDAMDIRSFFVSDSNVRMGSICSTFAE